eukprot:SAG22_NODE_275_length_13171_cov_11.640606_11_plen_211_part_00
MPRGGAKKPKKGRRRDERSSSPPAVRPPAKHELAAAAEMRQQADGSLLFTVGAASDKGSKAGGAGEAAASNKGSQAGGAEGRIDAWLAARLPYVPPATRSRVHAGIKAGSGKLCATDRRPLTQATCHPASWVPADFSRWFCFVLAAHVVTLNGKAVTKPSAKVRRGDTIVWDEAAANAAAATERAGRSGTVEPEDIPVDNGCSCRPSRCY